MRKLQVLVNRGKYDDISLGDADADEAADNNEERIDMEVRYDMMTQRYDDTMI